MGDLLAFIAFLANLIFFIWFGATLNSINRHLGNVADHTKRQTKLLASIANALDQRQHGEGGTTGVSADLT